MRMTLNALYIAIIFGCIVYFISPWLAVTLVVILSFELWIQFMPIWMQYPYYKFIWKKQKLRASSSNALFAYPMAIFIELSLDEHFKKGGIRAAQKAIMDQIDKIHNTLVSGLTEIANRNKSKT